MKQKGVATGLQMFEKTTGKNLIYINSNVQHNRAVKGTERRKNMYKNVYQS